MVYYIWKIPLGHLRLIPRRSPWCHWQVTCLAVTGAFPTLPVLVIVLSLHPGNRELCLRDPGLLSSVSPDIPNTGFCHLLQAGMQEFGSPSLLGACQGFMTLNTKTAVTEKHGRKK